MATSSDVIIIEDSSFSDPKGTAQLRKCFSAIIDRKKLNIDITSLKFIIQNDLCINLRDLDSKLIEVLPYMLVSYIKSWPGWDKSIEYYSGKLAYKEFFVRFRQYIIYKINFLIKNGYQRALSEIGEEDKTCLKKHEEAQTEAPGSVCKTFAPFSIMVDGPPRLLNTLLFTNEDDDIYFKLHGQKPWNDIRLKQLLNWPYLEVEFISPELSFSRKMLPNYDRYLAKINDPMDLKTQEFIEEVKKVIPSACRKSYSVQYVKQYIDQYVEYMKTPNLMKQSRAIELTIILEEFYSSVKEVAKECNNYIPDNTSILYNIGGCRYIRNKKINPIWKNDGVKAVPSSVGYCEIITPRCEIHLKKFTPEEDVETATPSFVYLNKMVKLTETSMSTKAEVIQSLPAIMYSCKFCNKQYGGSFALNAVMNHYSEDHKMEMEIMCYQCKNKYDVCSLATSRWYHKCVVKKS